MSVLTHPSLELGKGKDLKIPNFNVSIERKKAIPEEFKSIVPEDAVYFEGYANKATKDRIGDLIVPSFWSEKTLGDYMKNPVLLYMHDRKDVAGKIIASKQMSDGLWVAGFASGKWDKVWMIEEELVKSLSVWVWVDNAEWDSSTQTYKILEGHLLEVSFATIPMNADSTFDISKSMTESEYNIFRKHFKSKKMELASFLKSLIPGLAKKFNLGIKEDASAEDVLKAVNEAKGYDDLKKEITEEVTKSVTEQVMKSIKEKSEQEKDDQSRAKSDNDDAVLKLKADLQKQLDELEQTKKNLEGEIAKLKGEQSEQKSNTNQPPKTETAKTFFNTLSSASPEGESKY